MLPLPPHRSHTREVLQPANLICNHLSLQRKEYNFSFYISYFPIMPVEVGRNGEHSNGEMKFTWTSRENIQKRFPVILSLWPFSNPVVQPVVWACCVVDQVDLQHKDRMSLSSSAKSYQRNSLRVTWNQSCTYVKLKPEHSKLDIKTWIKEKQRLGWETWCSLFVSHAQKLKFKINKLWLETGNIWGDSSNREQTTESRDCPLKTETSGYPNLCRQMWKLAHYKSN